MLSSIQSAAFRGDLETVHRILGKWRDYRSNVDQYLDRDKVGRAITGAVENDHIEIVTLLLDYAADMGYSYSSSQPRLLQDAVIEANANMIQLLLDRGFRAQMYQCFQVTIVNGLIDLTRLLMPYSEGNITQQQKTNLLLLAQHRSRNGSIFQYLKTQWPSTIMEYNRQTLINAVREQDEDLIDILVNVLGMDVHAEDEELLRLATLDGNCNMVELLLREYGANVHAQNEASLRIAYAAQNDELLRILVELGANPQGIIPEGELEVVPFDEYTPAVAHTPLSTDSAYHGFFSAFCEHSGRFENRVALRRFRQIIINSTNHEIPLITHLSASDLRTINTGTQRQLCQWMQQKQNERSHVCRSSGQYDVEPFTQEPVNTIPLLFLWIHRNNTCFDLISLSRYIEANNRLNPLNRQPFTDEEIQAIRERSRVIYELMRTVFEMIPA